jgi:release factor glutamine methyltransferase
MRSAAAPDAPRTLLEALQRATAYLERKGIASPRLEAEVLLAHVLATTRLALYTGFDAPIGAPDMARYRDLLFRRATGTPTAYLVGEKEFWSIPLRVDPRVLIPRPDTEILVEEAARRGGRRILEIGTGSGAIAIAIAREIREAAIVATDLSEEALQVARENVARHGLEARIELRQGDLFDPVAGETFDLVVSNPPYVRHLDIPRLQPEIAYHEPRVALDGGEDGLAVLRRLTAGAPAHLVPGGSLVCEFGAGLAGAVVALGEAAGFSEIAVLRDLAGNERALAARWIPRG